MELIRSNHFNNDIVFVDGLGNVGKTLIARMLECFEGVEKQVEDEASLIIRNLYSLDKLSEDGSIVFLKLLFDRRLYAQYLGRQINTKFSDVTSIFKYPYPLNYIKRIFQKDDIQGREDVCRRIGDENPIFNNMTQNALSDGKLLFKAFGDRLKIIYIIRHPTNQILKMRDRGFMDRIGNCPTNTLMTFKYGKFEVPIFALGWEKEYLNMTDLERSTVWNYHLMKNDYDAYKKLSKKRKKQVMLVDYNKMLTNPSGICEEIEEFIGRKPTRKLKKIINSVYLTEIDDKEMKVRKGIGKDTHKYLDGTIETYNKFIDETRK